MTTIRHYTLVIFPSITPLKYFSYIVKYMSIYSSMPGLISLVQNIIGFHVSHNQSWSSLNPNTHVFKQDTVFVTCNIVWEPH